jgi:hypothetical protein
MRISNKTSTRKKWVIAICLIIVCLSIISLGVYATYRGNQNNSPTTAAESSQSRDSDNTNTNYSAPTDNELETGNSIKEDAVNPKSESNDDTVTNNQIQVTAYNTGNTIQIRSTISSNIPEGTCTLSLKKGSSNISIEAVGIQALSGYSTCKGWDVPISKLSSGTWSVKVSATYQSKLMSGEAQVVIP